jgi:hypothetical protein
MSKHEAGIELFAKVDASLVTKGAPPMAFYPVPDSYIIFKTHDELKAWEDHVRTRLGVSLRTHLGTSSESCSGGCSDDCD